MRVKKSITDTISVGTLFTLSALILATWNLLAPYYREKFHLDYQQLSFTFTALSCSSFVFVFLVTKVKKFFSNKMLSIVSAFLVIIFFALTPLYTAFTWLLLGLILLGACTGVLDLSRNLIALSLERYHKTKIFASLHGIYSLGSIIAYFLGALVDIFRFGFEMNQIIVIIICAALFLGFAKRIYNLPRASVESELCSVEQIKAGKQPWFLYFYAIICLALECTMENWTSSLFAQSNNYKNFSALCLLFFAAMMFLSRISLDQARRMHKEKQLLFISSIYLLIAFPACYFLRAELLRLVLFGFTGLAIGAIFPSSIIMMQSIKGINTEKFLARLISLTYIVFSCWPLVCGTISNYYGVGFTMTTGGSVCAILLFLALLKLLPLLSTNRSEILSDFVYTTESHL